MLRSSSHVVNGRTFCPNPPCRTPAVVFFSASWQPWWVPFPEKKTLSMKLRESLRIMISQESTQCGWGSQLQVFQTFLVCCSWHGLQPGRKITMEGLRILFKWPLSAQPRWRLCPYTAPRRTCLPCRTCRQSLWEWQGQGRWRRPHKICWNLHRRTHCQLQDSPSTLTPLCPGKHTCRLNVSRKLTCELNLEKWKNIVRVTHSPNCSFTKSFFLSMIFNLPSSSTWKTRCC